MFLANENFPKPSILFLREKGYEILSIQELYQGLSDIDVLKKAIADDLIILTFDKDYGELIFRYVLENPPSVIFFRSKGKDPLVVGQILHSLLILAEVKIKNAFTVIDENNIRQRFYSK